MQAIVLCNDAHDVINIYIPTKRIQFFFLILIIIRFENQ